MVTRKMIRVAMIAQLVLASVGTEIFAAKGGKALSGALPVADLKLDIIRRQKLNNDELARKNKELNARIARLKKAKSGNKDVQIVEVEKPVTKTVVKEVEKTVEVEKQVLSKDAIKELDNRAGYVQALNGQCDELQDDNTKLAVKANELAQSNKDLAKSRTNTGVVASVAGVAAGVGAVKAIQSETGQKVIAKVADAAKAGYASCTKENAKAAASFLGSKLSGAKDAVVSGVKAGYASCTKENAKDTVNAGVEVVKNNPKTSLAVAAGGLALAGFAAKKLYDRRQEAKAKKAALQAIEDKYAPLKAHQKMVDLADAKEHEKKVRQANVKSLRDKMDHVSKLRAARNVRPASKLAPKKGMSTLTKVGLGLASTAAVAGLGYAAYKNQDKIADFGAQALKYTQDSRAGKAVASFAGKAQDFGSKAVNYAADSKVGQYAASKFVSAAPVAPVVSTVADDAFEASFYNSNF